MSECVEMDGMVGEPGRQPLFAALISAADPTQMMHDETELIELQQTLAKAWLSHDRAMVERIIAPEWTSTYPDGHMTDRATVLAQVFETGAHKILGLKVDDVKVRLFGDAAVVTGRTHGVGEFEGNGYDVVIRFTDTFVRRAGQWQAVASHASLVQDS